MVSSIGKIDIKLHSNFFSVKLLSVFHTVREKKERKAIGRARMGPMLLVRVTTLSLLKSVYWRNSTMSLSRQKTGAKRKREGNRKEKRVSIANRAPRLRAQESAGNRTLAALDPPEGSLRF